MIRPVINNNGTAPINLIEPRLRAYRLLGEVVDLLKDVTPNGRDYPGDNDRCVADRQQHYERIKALRDIADELMLEALFIKQGEA